MRDKKMMNTKRIKSIEEFCNYATCVYYKEREHSGDDELRGINIVAEYDIISKVLNCLLKETKFWFIGGTVHDYEYAHYEKEFVLTIDGEGNIWIEPVYNCEKDRYLSVGDDLTLVHADCNSKFVTENYDVRMIEFIITDIDGGVDDDDDFDDFDDLDDIDDCDYDCMIDDDDDDYDYSLDIDRDDDDSLVGFTQHFSDGDSFMSRSFYSTDEELVKKVLASYMSTSCDE